MRQSFQWACDSTMGSRLVQKEVRRVEGDLLCACVGVGCQGCAIVMVVRLCRLVDCVGEGTVGMAGKSQECACWQFLAVACLVGVSTEGHHIDNTLSRYVCSSSFSFFLLRCCFLLLLRWQLRYCCRCCRHGTAWAFDADVLFCL